jgi:outer membrane protein
MKLILSFLLIIFCSPVFAQEPMTLKQAYDLALKRSEQLAIRQQLIKQAEARFSQSLSGILPKASFEYGITYEQGGDRSLESRFTFSQPLFSGFKEFAAMAGSKAERRQRVAEERRARQTLFVDVADAFYFYGMYQEELKSTESIAKALQDRLGELESRVKLGRSRQSELASSESRLRRAEADIEQTSSDMLVARELLEFLTGTEVSSIVADDAEPVLEEQTKDQLAAYAVVRPDVAAAREAMTVAAKSLVVARAGYWPEVSADANYYTEKSSSTTPDWDVGLKVSVPIFQGGLVKGQVSEAAALLEQAKLNLSETHRLALMDVRQSYTRYEKSLRRNQALKKAEEAATKNFELQTADYSHNMVNNLDVLQALQDLEDMRRSYIGSVMDVKRYYWQFRVASGELDDVVI